MSEDKKRKLKRTMWWMKVRQVLMNILTFGIACLVRYLKDRKVAKHEF